MVYISEHFWGVMLINIKWLIDFVSFTNEIPNTELIYRIYLFTQIFILILVLYYFIWWTFAIFCGMCRSSRIIEDLKIWSFIIIMLVFPCSYKIGYSRACIATLTRMELRKDPCWKPVCPLDDGIQRCLHNTSR